MPCTVWLDYSAARIGSRTTQQIMARLAAHGLLVHRTALTLGGPSAFRHSASSWSQLLDVMSLPCTSEDDRDLRVAVQLSDGDAKEFWTTWLPAIRKLRASPKACCRVIISTRVREPLSHYLSAYTWATAGKPNLGTQFARPRTRTLSGRTYSDLPTPSFISWAPPNLQSRVLLHGGSSKLITDEQSGKLPSSLSSFAAATPSGLQSLLQLLERDVDVVVPLERFDEGVREIARLLDLPHNDSLLEYERVSPRPRFYGGGPMGAARERAVAAACPNMSACQEHVARIAPLDLQLYQHVRALTQAPSQSLIMGARGRAPLERPLRSTTLRTGMSPRCAPVWARESTAAAALTTRQRLLASCKRTASSGAVQRDHTAGSSASRSSKTTTTTAAGWWAGLHGAVRAAAKSAVSGSRTSVDPSRLAAAVASFAGVCTGAVSVESLQEVTDDGMLGTAKPREQQAAAASGRVASQTSPIGVNGECKLPVDMRQYARPSDQGCEEVRAVFYFAPPPPPGAPVKQVSLPRIAPSTCNVAVVDSTTRFMAAGSSHSGGAQGQQHVPHEWKLRRIARWPFPGDAPRTAHFLKVAAPLIFPHARVVLAADIKCLGSAGCVVLSDTSCRTEMPALLRSLLTDARLCDSRSPGGSHAH